MMDITVSYKFCVSKLPHYQPCMRNVVIKDLPPVCTKLTRLKRAVDQKLIGQIVKHARVLDISFLMSQTLVLHWCYIIYTFIKPLK